MLANLENSAVATGTEKFSFHFNPKEGQCLGRFITLISHASKVMLKILQTRLQQYVKCELPDEQGEFRKSRGIRVQIANNLDHNNWIKEKAREFQKNIYFLLIDCVDHNKLEYS